MFLLLQSPKIKKSKACVYIIYLAWITVMLCDSPPAFHHQTNTHFPVLKLMSGETTGTHLMPVVLQSSGMVTGCNSSSRADRLELQPWGCERRERVDRYCWETQWAASRRRRACLWRVYWKSCEHKQLEPTWLDSTHTHTHTYNT